MNESVVKKTQEALGKVIKKPPLTEKLLSKPPFRYLHDIFNEVRLLPLCFFAKWDVYAHLLGKSENGKHETQLRSSARELIEKY